MSVFRLFLISVAVIATPVAVHAQSNCYVHTNQQYQQAGGLEKLTPAVLCSVCESTIAQIGPGAWCERIPDPIKDPPPGGGKDSNPLDRLQRPTASDNSTSQQGGILGRVQRPTGVGTQSPANDAKDDNILRQLQRPSTSSDDQSSSPSRQAPDVLAVVIEQLPFMSAEDVADLEEILEMEARDPLMFAILVAVSAALGAFGTVLLGGSGFGAPRWVRRRMALGFILGGLCATGAYVAYQGGLPVIRFLRPASSTARLVPTIGFPRGTAGWALPTGVSKTGIANERKLHHAAEHLMNAGLLPPWSKMTAERFVGLVTNILENPMWNIEKTLKKGPLPARGFIGMFNGRYIVVYVGKQQAGRYLVGDLATVVPITANHLKLWGIK